MRKKILSVLAAFAAAALLAALILFVQFKGNAVRAEYELYIGSQADYAQVVDSLMPHIRHRAAFRFYAKRIGLAKSFKPGHYTLTRGMNVIRIARTIKLGLQTPVRVTINNVRIPAQLAAKLAAQIEADSAALMAVLASGPKARELGFDSVTLFSMFIPDSYEFYWTVTPEELVGRMKREYDRFWTPERDALRKRSGLSRLEAYDCDLRAV